MIQKNLKTAECVTPKHPDKMCDRISDAVLDYMLERDPNARVAIETMGGHGRVFIVGELTANNIPGDAELEAVLQAIVERVTGDHNIDLDWTIVRQSPEIANGVDKGGAGDQGIMRGYATSETPSMMPLEYHLARSLCRFIFANHPYDGKTQVTLNDGKVETIVASFQNVEHDVLKQQVLTFLELYNLTDESIVIHCNPAGDWSQGGFEADTGLTGRKLMVDNYGPQVPIGGGAFSGKDATKVDRSAAYMARHIAVNYLIEHKAKEVSVELAYAIGVAEPVQATVTIDGVKQPVEGYNLTPAGIIEYLGLKTPQYEATACWGHFGNGYAWDELAR